jgi:hypothetical protein
VFLIALAVWALPRVLNLVPHLLGMPAPSGTDAPGTVELVTLDTAVTVMVATLAAWHWRTGRGADAGALTLVLVVSTLLAHASTLVPAGLSSTFFYVALIFPVVYDLAFDSEPLNESAPERPYRVVRTLSVRAALLLLLAVGIVLGQVDPFRASEGEVAYLLFAPPFTAWLVAAGLTARQAAAPAAVAVALPRREPQSLLAGAAAGLTVLVAMLVLALPLEPALARTGNVTGPTPAPAAAASPTPMPRTRYLEFAKRQFDRRPTTFALNQEMIDASARVDIAAFRTIGARMVQYRTDELAWLDTRPPADCYAAAWRAWRTEATLFGDLGQVLDFDLEAATEPQQREWLARLERAIDAWTVAGETGIPALRDAAEPCGAHWPHGSASPSP